MNTHLLQINIDAIIITIMYENRNPIDIFSYAERGRILIWKKDVRLTE